MGVGELMVVLESRNMNSKLFFFFLLVGWGLRPGPLEIEFQSLGLEASGEPMDSRNQGAAGFREYQATEDSVQRNLMRRC